MPPEAEELDLGDVKFLEILKESKCSVIFKVLYHQKACVLKVYHNRPYREWDVTDREINAFVCESSAYCRLKAHGLCRRRVIPDFYGIITNIEPNIWPDLKMFVDVKDIDDALPPTAILIEYVPNMHEIDVSHFSPRYMQEIREILEEIHRAGVIHMDTAPRNMVISEDPSADQARVLWIDFDRAQALPENTSIPEEKKEWMREEMDWVDNWIQCLTQDNEHGELYHAYSHYYEWYAPLGWDFEIQQEKRLEECKKRREEHQKAIENEKAAKAAQAAQAAEKGVRNGADTGQESKGQRVSAKRPCRRRIEELSY